ncbi:hypothetical protein FHS94_001316 [Sphingomonas aerophila]|uniref:Uncharacterized protein n=1 Tax=Sphingomonas aerophila TaxID=1344948 RepID=A0A7W9ETU1_9SPHN|nr:hypothetical protein [Sphingomonas aerophila]MBB5714485.1 hypothetical protein [Sphingomonas aerophila]
MLTPRPGDVGFGKLPVVVRQGDAGWRVQYGVASQRRLAQVAKAADGVVEIVEQWHAGKLELTPYACSVGGAEPAPDDGLGAATPLLRGCPQDPRGHIDPGRDRGRAMNDEQCIDLGIRQRRPGAILEPLGLCVADDVYGV